MQSLILHTLSKSVVSRPANSPNPPPIENMWTNVQLFLYIKQQWDRPILSKLQRNGWGCITLDCK